MRHIERLERVQRRATRMMGGGDNLDYEMMGLTTLETRRIRAG